MDTPKLSIPIVCFLVAALALAMVLKIHLPDWLRFWLASIALIFGAIGLVTVINWLTYTGAHRIRDMADARTYGARVMANAIRDLSSDKTQAVLALDQVYLEMYANETGPVFLVRTLAGNVPFDFAIEFFEKCRETDPYLWPVRECSNKEWGAWLTNYIIAKGWAERSTGPLPAKFLKPLPMVAGKFGVELENELA